MQSFPSGLLNQGPRDSLYRVKGVLDYDSGVCCFKEVKLLPKY